MMKILLSLLSLLWRGLSCILTPIFGRLSWQPPAWLTAIGRACAYTWHRAGQNRLLAFISVTVLFSILFSAWQGWQAYLDRPLPQTVDYQIVSPEVTDYSKDPMVIAPLRIRFDQAVAPLAQTDKSINTGARLSPSQEGTWRWIGDRVLEFTPSKDWPIDAEIRIDLARNGLLDKGILLDDYHPTFHTAPFRAWVVKSMLYQDPTDPDSKKAVATLGFSHPVNKESLTRAISLKPGQGLNFQDKKTASWTLLIDDNQMQAHIHSANLTMPLENTSIELIAGKGIVAASGGNQTEKTLKTVVEVPGRYRLTFSEPEIRYIKDEEGRSRQVLVVESSFPVKDEEIARHVHAWLLPAQKSKQKYYLSHPEHFAQLEQLALTQIPGAAPLNQHHSFYLDVPVERLIWVKVDANVEATGGYLSKEVVTSQIATGNYPRSLQFMGEGAILGLNGEKSIGFIAQGVDGAKVEIARILPGQLHQLVDQNYRSFAKPSLYGVDLDRLVEREVFLYDFGQSDPAKPVYGAVDLSNYLDSKEGRRGVFIVRIMPYDRKNPDRSYSDYASGPENGDRRLLLLSDLGIIAKKNMDNSHDIFVQSIGNGTPCKDVRIDILGRNGQPVAVALTDTQGHAHLPPLEDLQREKTPIMLTAALENDFSYLPLNDSDHIVNFSRFDVGGARNQQSEDQLSAYLFTDRDLYRPGETAHIAYILRAAQWDIDTTGIPLQIVVTDSRGTMVAIEHRRLVAGGFDSIDYTSSPTSPTGDYRATVYLVKDDKSRTSLGTVWFRVEEFEPDRMKVQLHLADKPTKGWLRPEDVHARVQARHLFGANASDRRVGGMMFINPSFPSFSQYKQYRFHVEETLKNSMDEELDETFTDENGEAFLALHLDRFQADSYNLTVVAQVYEAEGGRNVAAQQSALVSSAPYLIGVSSPDSLRYVSKDAKRSSHWLAIDNDLQPVAVGDLRLSLIEYRYVSVLVKQDDGTYKYESRRKEHVRDKQMIKLPEQGLQLDLPTGEPGDFAYELRDAKDKVLARLSWTVAGSGNLTRSLERNAEMQIRLDKQSYAPGETINVSLRSPYTGAGLITIERDKVYAWSWFKADTTSSVQQITVPEGIEGNAYVNVQFVRDPSSPEIFMSPLSSGAASFALSLDQRTLELRVDAPKLLQPGEELRVHLNAGKAARGLVFAIDEGILQVARYETPAPLAHFFPKRELSVQTHQILSLILPEFSLLYQASAPGGGADDDLLAAHLNPFKRKNRPPVVYWSGIVDLPAEGRTFSYTVPDYFNGRMRIMAVALTPEQIGVSKDAVEVRGPWILSPNIPAFVAPGDEFVISTGLFNNLATEQTVTLSLQPGAGITLLDGDSRKLTVAPQREGLAEFRLRAEPEPGSIALDFSAQSEDGSARLHEEISVRPATPYRVALQTGLFRAPSISLPPTRELFAPYRKVRLNLGFSPLVWSEGLKIYLEEYPYGCTEQLLSRAMPALMLASSAQLQQPDFKNITIAFAMLRERCHQSGGFTTWPSSNWVDATTSVYASDFLLEAKSRGVAVPAFLLDHGQRYLKRIAQQPAEGMDELRTRAQAIYLLTRQGFVMTPALTSTVEQLERYHPTIWRKDLTAAYLAASYQLLQQKKEAEALIAGVKWSDIKQGVVTENYALYKDNLVHDAELLSLLARHFPKYLGRIPDQLILSLGERLNKNQYHSLSAGLLIRAFSLYQDSMGKEAGRLEAELWMEDQGKKVPLQLAGLPAGADLPLGWRGVLLWKKDSQLPAFYMISEAGFDRQPPKAALMEGLEVRREYVNAQGEVVNEVSVGDSFTVRLFLRATKAGSIENVAIVDLLPGGVEPIVHEESRRNYARRSNLALLTPYFVDTRDDRVILYATLTRDTAVYEYQVRAVNAGSFQTPPPYAEGMYDRTVVGLGQAEVLRIIKPEAGKEN